jgi:hypothetical protein
LENEAIQELILTAETSPDTQRLAADIEALREQQTNLFSRLGRLDGLQRDRTARERELQTTFGLRERTERIARLRNELDGLQRTNQVLQAELEALQVETNALANRLTQERQETRRIWLLPELDASEKKPVLVTVSGTRLTWERWDDRDSRREVGGGDAEVQFARYLQSLDNDRDYLVFYVRPSGIGLFKRCRSTAAAAGFEVGHDAVEENQEIIFRDPAAP